jgi:aspartate kinase
MADAGVNIEMTSTSGTRISIIVREADLDAWCKAPPTLPFGLDADQIEAVVYGGTGR